VDGVVEALGRVTGGIDFLSVSERSRTLYVRVPKAACTTMLWGLLELEGHDPSTVNRSLRPLLSTPDLVVHDPDLYPVPDISQVSPALRRAALESPEWLRVAVVRNPYRRLYSAWESKVLTLPPGLKKFRPAPEPIEHEGRVDIGESFRAFVRFLSEDPHRWPTDTHFWPQTDLVPMTLLPDIELVPTEGIPDLFRRLSERAGTSVVPRRTNEGLGIDGSTLLDDETAKLIFSMYGPDFALSGADPGDYSLGEPVVLTPTSLALLRLAGARNERAVQLHDAHRQTPEERPTDRMRRLAARLGRS
jgi:hypothetical protein